LIDRIDGAFVPYSRYLAARRDAELASELDLWALGVMGMLWCPEGVVIGRRSCDTTDAGQLENVPSGTIDGPGSEGIVDIDRVVVTELREETGLTRQELDRTPEAFLLVGDQISRVADIVVTLRTSLSFAEIRAKHESLAVPEHDSLEVVAASKPSLIGFSAVSFLPSSIAALRHAGLSIGR
jgi:hypothetical protein